MKKVVFIIFKGKWIFFSVFIWKARYCIIVSWDVCRITTKWFNILISNHVRNNENPKRWTLLYLDFLFYGFASLFSWILFERTMMMPMSWEEKVIWLMFLLYLPLIPLLFSFTMNPSSITKKSSSRTLNQMWISKCRYVGPKHCWISDRPNQFIIQSIFRCGRERERVRERERERDHIEPYTNKRAV